MYKIKRKQLIGVLAFLTVWVMGFTIPEKAASAEKPDFKVIMGEWVRIDGGYVINVSSIKEDGSVDVGSSTPREIYVAEAKVSLWKGMVRLYIKLQDKGYPGSTYTLYYNAEKKGLAGFYYQAVQKQTYEVVFVRKPKRKKRAASGNSLNNLEHDVVKTHNVN